MPFDPTLIPAGQTNLTTEQINTEPSPQLLNFVGEKMLDGQDIRTSLKELNISPLLWAYWLERHPKIRQFTTRIRAARAELIHEEFFSLDVKPALATPAKNQSLQLLNKIKIKQEIMSKHKKEDAPNDYHTPSDDQNLHLNINITDKRSDEISKEYEATAESLQDFAQTKSTRMAQRTLSTFTPEQLEEYNRKREQRDD